MIKKYIENTEEIRQRLTGMLMDDAKERRGYVRDIYMYIDETGRASLEWFDNVGGNSWIDDDHILLYRCREHCEAIQDSIEGIDMIADIIGMSSDDLRNMVCQYFGIDINDIQYSNCIDFAMMMYGYLIKEWYEGCIDDAASDYADQANKIMISHNATSLCEAYHIEDSYKIVPIVWLFTEVGVKNNG